MLLLNADAYPSVNPPLIQAYLDANGIIMGKTNLAGLVLQSIHDLLVERFTYLPYNSIADSIY